jgi:glycosyltransferase EpsD
MIEKQKILFTSHTANFFKFNKAIIEDLAKSGYLVDYASANEELITSKSLNNIYSVSFRRNPFDICNIKAILQMSLLLKRNKYSIIHAHTPVGGAITRLSALITGTNKQSRIIYTAHGFHFYKGAPLLNWLVYYPIEKILSLTTDDIITINTEDYEIARNKFYAKRTHFLDCGVGIDTNFFLNNDKRNLNREVIRKELGIQENDIVLLYAAELNKNKNQIFLVKAMQKLLQERSNVKMIFCGVGPLFHKYEKIIKKLGLKDTVYLLGYRKDMNEIVRASDIYVSASIREGLSVSVLEAISCGLPVLVSDNRGHRDIVKNNNNVGFIYTQNDTRDFIKKIKILINSKERFKKNINSGIAKIYSSQRSVEEIRLIYNRGIIK